VEERGKAVGDAVIFSGVETGGRRRTGLDSSVLMSAVRRFQRDLRKRNFSIRCEGFLRNWISECV